MSATLYNSDICEYTQADTNRCSFFIIMYQIKNIVIIFFLMLVPVGVTAQYQKAQEKAPFGQCTFGKFCITAESPF